MNICLISHGDFDYDGRLRELFKVFSNMGTLYSFTRGSKQQDDNHKLYAGGYPGFIREAVKYGKTLPQIDLLVLDNRKSVIPGLMLRKIMKPRLVIQDCRELYIARDVEHFAGKVGCVIEKWGIDRADLIICANQERADFMQEIYRLKQRPIVYENVRQLQYSAQDAWKAAEERFKEYIHDGEIRIISTYGCSVSRTNDVLVRNLNKVTAPCRLFLVGGSTPQDLQVIQSIIAEEKLENVHCIDLLNQDALKYLISQCHIGIVNYNQKDLNNKFCASGKVYEFIYEGIPVVTTTNPPLKRMCEEGGIGASDDAYWNGINEVCAHYDAYQTNARVFAASHPVEKNNAELQRQLEEQITRLLAK